jgi:hypothetical protein
MIRNPGSGSIIETNKGWKPGLLEDSVPVIDFDSDLFWLVS